ncbi:Laccase 2 [Daphnia magna]|uniref:Laccase 2 n=1 Tax=Daphnia magna TaxID=35525 RepID=A0A0P5SWM3_9CRUS|nr:Laccase 2 [Daphnia magna]
MARFDSCALILLVTLLFIVSASSAKESAHDCQRVCDGGPARRCVYDFHVEYYFTMSKACFDCPHKGEDCDRHHCIPADGIERGVIAINRQLPGPSIQVCEGDRIIVNVKNHLPGESCTIHWHGIHQVGSPYMDGVPLVTQCPISPASSFRYNFIAENPGTHFYHSHSGFQRSDGVFGSLVVRQNKERDPHSSLYDYDLPEHVMMISDWLGELGVAKFVAHHHDDGDNKPSSMIINGRGRIPKPRNELTSNETMPLSVFNVEQGRRYRFRVISNGFLNCPIQLSVDDHMLTVIASDGGAIQPIEVDSLVIHAGERYDFIVNAGQEISSYWIRLHGLMDCGPKRVFQAAILRYHGALETEPDAILTYENTNRLGKVLNPVNIAPGDDEHITVAELKAMSPSKTNDWSREPDRKFVLSYDFNPINSWHFHDPEHYPIFGAEKNHRLYTPQINHISLRMPPSPPLSQHGDLPFGTLCNESTVVNCQQEFCDCTYTLQIPLGSLVELILIDKGVTFDATHPFHIHGSAFHVVAMERVASNVTVDQIKLMDQKGHIRRNLVDAPVKDTVAVPDGGYTIVRFMATNPGYWLFHCHLSFHIEVGMGLIFKVGEHHDFPQVPENFPKCGSWLPPVDEDEFESIVIHNLPYNVTDKNEKFGDGTTLRPPTSSDLDESFSFSSGESELTTEVPFTLSDEDNFVIPQHLTNGTLSHSESPMIHATSGANPFGISFISFALLPFGYIYTVFVRR